MGYSLLNRSHGEGFVGPEWLRNDRFSIIARAPAYAPKGQIPAKLQTLLAQRFGMKVYWETR